MAEYSLRLFENRLLWRIFGPNWKFLGQNEDIYTKTIVIICYSSPDVIRLIKSRSMRWTGHVTLVGEIRNAYKMLIAKPERKINNSEENTEMGE
jgi:hypothetical protein